MRVKSDRKMKDSVIEWIGEIPEGWKISRIKHVADVDPRVSFENIDESTIITYTPMECVKNGYYEKRETEFGSLAKSLTMFQEGDIVMAKVTPCFENGNIAIMEGLESGIGLGSSELFVFRSKDILTKYLFYWLQNEEFMQRACSTMTGAGGLKRVSPYFINNCEIHLPPISEQQKIISYIDEKCAKLDAVIEKQRASIEELKAYKLAVITEAVTRGLNPDVEMKDSGIEWVSKVPVDIIISRVGLHYDIILGKMLCPEQPNDAYTLEQYYCAADVHFDGISVTTERKKMWFNTDEKKLYLVNNGDLLVVEGGAGAGGCAIVEKQIEPTYVQNSIMIVRNKRQCDVKYLRYWIECLVNMGYIDVVCNKATLPHFTKDKLSKVPLLLFPLPEQQAISDYLDKKCSEINAIIDHKQQLIEKLTAYKKSLIYEVVTGKKEVT